MVEFVAIITLVAGVLQIILFFKVWGMTNDIRELKKDYFSETHLETYYHKAIFARKNLILGKKESVKAMFLKNFLNNLEQNYTKGEDSIQPYVDNLKKQFSKLGEELPDYISNLKTFEDYHKLFTKNDFIIEK
ncbi:MAG: hypothetical protein E7107_07780 [Prevotella sp.]|jgi:hypothetical protein|nr:hypothetical protein [Prevotella sp.]